MNSVLQQGSQLNQGSRLTLILKRGSWGQEGDRSGVAAGESQWQRNATRDPDAGRRRRRGVRVAQVSHPLPPAIAVT
jgi:hypothetical protein